MAKITVVPLSSGKKLLPTQKQNKTKKEQNSFPHHSFLFHFTAYLIIAYLITAWLWISGVWAFLEMQTLSFHPDLLSANLNKSQVRYVFWSLHACLKLLIFSHLHSSHCGRVCDRDTYFHAVHKRNSRISDEAKSASITALTQRIWNFKNEVAL